MLFDSRKPTSNLGDALPLGMVVSKPGPAADRNLEAIREGLAVAITAKMEDPQVSGGLLLTLRLIGTRLHSKYDPEAAGEALRILGYIDSLPYQPIKTNQSPKMGAAIVELAQTDTNPEDAMEDIILDHLGYGYQSYSDNTLVNGFSLPSPQQALTDTIQ